MFITRLNEKNRKENFLVNVKVPLTIRMGQYSTFYFDV